MLLHSSGQSVSAQFSMPVKDASNPQAVGSALTYARRYALMAAIGVAPEDDDGNTAAGPKAAPVVRTQTIDWDFQAKGFLATSGKAKNDVEKRALYARLRDSQMPEPLKTSTLTALANEIKGKK